MMLSSWETKRSLPSAVGNQPAACATKKSVIARPSATLRSSLEEKLHLDARELDHVVILERMRRGADLLAVDGRAVGALDVGNEVAGRAPREHRDLHAGLAERGERLVELELLAGIAAGQQLDRAERPAGGRARGRCSGGYGRGCLRGGGRGRLGQVGGLDGGG